MHSEQQISSICYAVGFNNVANFNRRFREVKGVTPREFRRQSMDRLGSDTTPNRQGQ
jgi:AraC-like DNA-binding protein